jgi:cell division protein FtsL
MLALLVVVAALAVVYVRHQNRVSFVRLQALHGERDELNVEFSQLLLEQATWSVQPLVEKQAREKLQMVRPDHADIVTVRLNTVRRP